jgi:glycosyltransferase involved in cell wall biosynthesis/2-polyprenyl-3-methyl-5-hydroxy-6-metoxy-1,4-benzoquinol methylase
MDSLHKTMKYTEKDKYHTNITIDDNSSHSIALRMIKPNSVVLEFGPALGDMTRYLKNELGCQVYIVELSEEYAQLAGQYAEKTFVGDIEELKWLEEYKGVKFDYILFMDVLEHLRNPEKVIISSKELLSKTGEVILSVPNIAHNSIIMELLENNFTYSDAGLLDRTHCYFFAYNSLCKLIKDTGLYSYEIAGSNASPSMTEFNKEYDDLNNFKLKELLSQKMYGEVYQFIFRVGLEQKELLEIMNNIIEPEFIIGNSQLFWGKKKNRFSEKNSIHSTVVKSPSIYLYTVVFDINRLENDIKSLRFDPFSEKCLIEIESIILKNDSGEESVLDYKHINATNKMGDILYFDHCDSAVLVNIAGVNIDKYNSLHVEFSSCVIGEELEELERYLLPCLKRHKIFEFACKIVNHCRSFISIIYRRIDLLIYKLVVSKIESLVSFIKRPNFSFKKVINYARREGFKKTIYYMRFVFSNPGLVSFYKYVEPKLTDKIKNELVGFDYKPLMSIVMPVYNVDPKWLELAINSIKNQWYDNWELCIADDCSTNDNTKEYLQQIKDERIKVKFLDKNLNISGASNEALSLATGDYVVLMDNDDEITCDALYEIVKAINTEKAEFIYSDSDYIDVKGKCSAPFFKPDFSHEMLVSMNYFNHITAIKKTILDEIGGWEVGLEGSQDHDLYLKVIEQTDEICHIQKVLYHWRTIPGSAAAEYSDKSYAWEAGKQAVENHLKRIEKDASVSFGYFPGTYRVKYQIKGQPLVSIIIPFKDRTDLLNVCIDSVLKSTYEHYEIICINNNSEEQQTFDEMKRLSNKSDKISFYDYDKPFNYSAINNYAVNLANGEYLVFLNNDIKVISKDWLESFLSFAQQESIGAVGGRLYYENGTIQHAGVIVGVNGIAGHSHRHFPASSFGYYGRICVNQDLLAVTAACLMLNKQKFLATGGFQEEDLAVAFNDVDLCLRLVEHGYTNIYTPYVEAYHYESTSRGSDLHPKNIDRFKSELEYMKTRHKDILESGDPFYNPNLTLEREDFTQKMI